MRKKTRYTPVTRSSRCKIRTYIWQGKTFGYVIQDFLDGSEPLVEYLEIYESSAEGREIYDECLNAVESYFPQYLIELKGMADGAAVPFHEVCINLTILYYGDKTTLKPDDEQARTISPDYRSFWKLRFFFSSRVTETYFHGAFLSSFSWSIWTISSRRTWRTPDRVAWKVWVLVVPLWWLIYRPEYK